MASERNIGELHLNQNKLLKLPNEIWSLVFEFVPFQDCVKHRLVSKWWRKNVDELSSVYVDRICDQMSVSARDRIFQLRVRSCGISNLRNPFEPNFAFPLLLKEITFGTNVSSENMLKILSVLYNVEALTFFTTISSDISFKEGEDCIQVLNGLKNLKSIEIGVHCFADRKPAIFNPTFNTMIGSDSVLFPALNKLSLTYTMYHSEWIKLYSFIAKHSNTLKHLHIKCQCVKSQSDMDGVLSKMVNVINVSDFTKLKLSTLIVQSDRSSCNCKNDEVWMKILSAQKCLKTISTDLVSRLSIILELVQNNEQTLNSVTFYDVYLEIGDILDGEVFSKCKYLQVLQLHFVPAYVMMVDIREVGKKPQLSNFEFTGLPVLPQSLVKLNLQGCEILTSDLLEMSTRLYKLQDLDLGPPGISVGVSNNMGVSFDVFIKLCTNLNRLKCLKLHKDILNIKPTSVCSSKSIQPGSTLWSKILSTAKELSFYDKEPNESVIDMFDTNVYEFNFKQDTIHSFIQSLYALKSEGNNCSVLPSTSTAEIA